jgi:uncharacterized iron-regulated protein
MLKKIIALSFIMGVNFIFAMDKLSEMDKKEIRSAVNVMKENIEYASLVDFFRRKQSLIALNVNEKAITEILRKYPMSKKEKSEWLVEIGSKPLRKEVCGSIFMLDFDSSGEEKDALSLDEKISQWSVWLKKLDEVLLCEKE